MQLPASLQVERDGDVAIVRLARVAKRNALDDEAIRGIETLFRDLPEGVRAVVLSARGEHFSSGLDLSTLVDATSPAPISPPTSACVDDEGRP